MMPGGVIPQRVAGDCLAASAVCAQFEAVANPAL